MSKTGARNVLICRVGGMLCALPLELVTETMRPLPVEAMPETPDFVTGVSLIRGEPVPVVAGHALVRGQVRDPERLVALRLERGTVALSVDAVLGVSSLNASTLAGLPPVTQQASAAISQLGVLDGALLRLLETTHVVPEDVWAGIDARRAAL